MIYVGYPCKISFSVGALAAGSSVRLQLCPPGMTSGTWYGATISDLATGSCYVDLFAPDLTVSGLWTGYPEVTTPGGAVLPGTSISFEVFEKNVRDIPYSTPRPEDIRDLLEDYGLDQYQTLNLAGSWVANANVVTAADTQDVRRGDLVFGTGIPAGARVDRVISIGQSTGEFTIDSTTTAPGTGATARQYMVLSDGWLINTRDRLVIPWVEKHTRQSFRGIQTITEYYDGTGSSLLFLRRRPIVDLIAISYTNVDSNFYYLTPYAIQVLKEEGILKAKAHFNESSYVPIFYKGDKNLRVTYKFGYLDYPTDVAEAVARLVAEQALAHVGSKTGGGNLSAQGYSRSFGQIGKWTEARRNLAKTALAILKPRMTGSI